MTILTNMVSGLVLGALGGLVFIFVRALVKPFPKDKDDDKN